MPWSGWRPWCSTPAGSPRGSRRPTSSACRTVGFLPEIVSMLPISRQHADDPGDDVHRPRDQAPPETGLGRSNLVREVPHPYAWVTDRPFPPPKRTGGDTLVRRVRALVAVTALALALGLAGAALAASWTVTTSLTIVRSPTGTVAKGTLITFKGRLRADRALCKRYQEVRLVRVGVGVVGSTTTNGWGKYVIRKRVYETARWRTQFPGFIKGVHPNVKVCLSSESRIKKVPVA